MNSTFNTKIYALHCHTCENVVAFSFKPINQLSLPKTYCFLCAHNICDLAEKLGSNAIPNKHALYRADPFEDTTQPKRDWRQKMRDAIIRFCS